MKAVTAILMTTVAAVQLQQGGQDDRRQMTDEQLARDLDASTCGYFLQSIQQNVGLPLNDENEERIRNTIKENGVQDVDKIVGTIQNKVGKCHDKIRAIDAGSMKDWTCEEFVLNGKEEGWLNPSIENWEELFDPSEELKDAMTERFEACEGRFRDAQREHFGDFLEA